MYEYIHSSIPRERERGIPRAIPRVRERVIPRGIPRVRMHP